MNSRHEGTGRCDAPFTNSWKLERGNEYLSLPVLKLGVGGVLWVSSTALSSSPYTEWQPKSPGLFGSLTAGSPCCTQDT